MSEQDFRVVKDVKLDSRGRLTLGSLLKAKRYHVMVNNIGQILLDPVVSVPGRELWLWQNSEALASVKRGLEQSATEEGQYCGDFSDYANLEME